MKLIHVPICLFLLVAWNCSHTPGMPARVIDDDQPVTWIDTDFGFDPDDFMALLVAGRTYGDRLAGVSTTLFKPELKARLVRVVLDELGLEEVPVFSGAGAQDPAEFRSMYPRWPSAFGEPYKKLGEALVYVFGAERLGNAKVQPGAAERLAEAARRYKGKLRVVVLGPMTNVADALRHDPEFCGQVAELVVMGGWYEHEDGSVRRPSYNTLMDIGAAAEVFGRPECRVLLVNSQALRSAGLKLKASEIARMREKSGSKLGRALLRDMDNWIAEVGGHVDGFALPDPAVALVAHRRDWVAATVPVWVRVFDLPGVHMLHPDAGKLLARGEVTSPETGIRVVSSFSKPDELRQDIIDVLMKFF